MAIGDQLDIEWRIKSLLPPSWFGDDHPLMNAIVTACATSLAWCYSLYVYAQLQTRINSATDGWLDIIANDFFGTNIQRVSGQSDDLFRNQIRINLFRERGTRKAIIDILEDITGKTPLIFEPQNPIDTGAYGGPTLGYGVAGGYGSQLIPYQAFVTAYRPSGSGIPFIAGYSSTPSGYSSPSRGMYAERDMINGGATDEQIYAAIASVKMEGTIVWVRIQ
ncbi:hypothetical protein ACX1H8_22000 [Yersinia enterocolitica]|uniref:hypothetical protein n=1 Tax=Yersinia enterocolitica TaxID=630 RepID=UPI0029AD3C12|nr:hypothetical protein [Yersinia enterocolitica]HDL7723302.1 hypothetical protein [Yersinia enterocolitica]HEI6713606.1 hypothetical protein [Yersinia enterocolitica]HEI6730870.1 hypothetical protein [Yersinia enterocolitica]HEI6984310.1 hypothetical protein [Yersinia enterocolitica]